MTAELHYWIALLHVYYGNCTNKIINLLTKFNNLTELCTEHTDLLQKIGLASEDLEKILHPNTQLIEANLKWLNETGHHFITYSNTLYPQILREISNPPLGLFLAGNPNTLSTQQIAIVGSRKASVRGLETATEFAQNLATKDFTITSGFAHGIDTASHKGALAVHRKTIGVMGTGLKKIYPECNTYLIDKIIAEDGALISEFPLNTPPKSINFPQRNRIISGLSLGVLVVEANLYSGSLITARFAAEQGREVFAIPGTIYSALTKGCHKLIQEGAKLVENIDDILVELRKKIPATTTLVLDNKKSQPINLATPKNINIDLPSQKLLDYIEYEAVPIDLLIVRSGLTAPQVTRILLNLELEGYITSINGNYIKLNKK